MQTGDQLTIKPAKEAEFPLLGKWNDEKFLNLTVPIKVPGGQISPTFRQARNTCCMCTTVVILAITVIALRILMCHICDE